MSDREPATGPDPGGPGGFLLLRRGETLRDGRYVLERRLGSGGMAAVWLASDELLGRAVAIKLMSETIVDEPAWVERFRREARVAASLSHPNLVDVYDFEPTGPRPYLVMAHVPGGTLAERIEAGDPPEPRRLAAELLAALTHMHAAGVLHRDVKTSNVMLAADGTARLGDFGISRPRDAPSVTDPGQVLGSARYMAPEVMAGEPYTEGADLYSTGIVLSELLRERPDPKLESIAAELANDAPESRPRSARQARARIEAARPAREQTETTRRVDPPQPVSVPARREPAMSESGFVPPPIERRRPFPRFIALAALLCIVIAVAVVLALSGGGDGDGSAGTSGQAESTGSGSASGGSGSESSNSGSGSGSTSGAQPEASQAVVPEPTAGDPTLAATLDEQGKGLIDSGDPAAAIPVLRRAVIASDPDAGDTYAFALYNLGNALRLAGRPQSAVLVLEARLQVPNQTEAVQAELDLAEADAGFD